MWRETSSSVHKSAWFCCPHQVLCLLFLVVVTGITEAARTAPIQLRFIAGIFPLSNPFASEPLERVSHPRHCPVAAAKLAMLIALTYRSAHKNCDRGVKGIPVATVLKSTCNLIVSCLQELWYHSTQILRRPFKDDVRSGECKERNLENVNRVYFKGF